MKTVFVVDGNPENLAAAKQALRGDYKVLTISELEATGLTLLDRIVKERTERIEQLQKGIVFTFANTVESRDKVSSGHITRISKYLKVLIDAMIDKGVYSEELTSWDLDTVIASSNLHDVGKIVVSDFILNKQGKLTFEEFHEITRHTTEGEKLIDQMIAQTGDAPFLHHARLFAGSHHERWDGKGYPRNLEEEEIPLQGRIMAIVDVYDALVSERPYKPAFSNEEAEEIIKNDAGAAFDPLIIDIFNDVKEEFAAIAKNNKGDTGEKQV